MYVETQPAIVFYDTQLAAIIILIMSSIGFVANAIVAFFTHKLPTMNNPFGRLTASQAVAETVLLGTFMVFFAPMMLTDNTWMLSNSAWAGFFNLIAYDICIWSHLFISLNRLAAIVFPLHYDKIFSKRNTYICIFYSWITAIVTAIVLYKLHVCDFYYSNYYWAFVFTTSDVCKFISWNIDFYKDLSIVIIIGLVDCITIWNVHRTAKSSLIGSQMQRARRKREVNFLKQACLQGVVFVIELFTYFYLAWKLDGRWSVFMLTTFAWISVHMLDGIIIIAFNREFRKLVTTPFKRLYVSGHSTSHSNDNPGITGATGTGATGTGVNPFSQEIASGHRLY